MFSLNGIVWYVVFVPYDDPILYDYRNNVMSVATTDYFDKCIYLSDNLYGNFLLKVLKHELYHCYEFSMIAHDLPIFEEENVASFISNYGEELINLAYDIYDYIS